jgi:hypothetical protein
MDIRVCRGLALAVVGVAVVQAGPYAQTSRSDQLQAGSKHRSDFEALRSGNDDQVGNALEHILSTPPGDRPVAIWRAVADAYLRHHRGYRPDPNDPDPVDGLDPLFVQVLIESREPLVIPVLVVSTDNNGYPVWDALAKFGDQAILPLITAAQTEYGAGAVMALTWILEHPSADPVTVLSDNGRQQILLLARELWQHRRRHWQVEAGPMAELALLTHDADLRKQIESVAVDPDAWTRPEPVSAYVVASGQRGVQRALKKYP